MGRVAAVTFKMLLCISPLITENTWGADSNLVHLVMQRDVVFGSRQIMHGQKNHGNITQPCCCCCYFPLAFYFQPTAFVCCSNKHKPRPKRHRRWIPWRREKQKARFAARVKRWGDEDREEKKKQQTKPTVCFESGPWLEYPPLLSSKRGCFFFKGGGGGCCAWELITENIFQNIPRVTLNLE